MSGIYLEDWDSADKVYRDFDVQEPEGIEILLACYTYVWYEGSAFVLYRDNKDGKLYEVNGGHCSCYGLEGQWSPEETNVEVLRHRIEKGRLGQGYDGEGRFVDELTAVLDAIGGDGNSEIKSAA
ncbi:MULTISPECIES: hypothetical protein [Paenibacillus]|uniref:Uncharacterized protein n=1 Tax=Paenibacillus tundrae TaxID=528187 RepID=A0ABT9W6N6_9BACL|nr:hypothetical protein [Paenibacillus tundrae]MDQ0168724.1 hypothetical protein [Paenibacillus tundrae]